MIHNITIKCYDDYIVNWQLLISFSVYHIEIKSLLPDLNSAWDYIRIIPGWRVLSEIYKVGPILFIGVWIVY